MELKKIIQEEMELRPVTSLPDRVVNRYLNLPLVLSPEAFLKLDETIHAVRNDIKSGNSNPGARDLLDLLLARVAGLTPSATWEAS